MTVNLSALGGAGAQFFDGSGDPLTGGKLYSYEAGTTTPKTTYTTAAGNVAHANPIILNSAGRIATGEIWLTASENYKFVLADSNDVVIATWDNITGINGTGITSNASNVTYDPAGVGAVATTVQAKLREYVSVKDFGAVGDGITDDTVAIQACLNANKSTVGPQPTVTRIIFFPTGTYLISSSLQVTSGQQLYGEGRKSLLKQTTGLTGQLIDLYGISGYCNEVIIENLGFETSGTVWAIKASAGVIGQGLFKNLIFNCGYCLSLATYTQSCVVDTLLSVGPLDQLLHFKGNRNYIIHLDKEGSTGSSSDPYVLIENHAGGKSNGNVIDDVLIEQATSANKYPVKFDGVEKLEFLNYWIEPTNTTGYGIYVANSTFVHIGGYYQTPYSTNNKVKIENTTQVIFDYFDGNSENVPLSALLEIDSASSIIIESLQLRRMWEAVRADYPNVLVRQFVNQTANDVAATQTPIRPLVFGGNMLQNPSFTAGTYGWSDFSSGTGTVTTPASDLNSGVMLQIDYGTSGIRVIGQQFTITADMVGHPFTLSGWVKVVAGLSTGWIATYVSGGGAPGANGNDRVYINEGWQFISSSFTPQSAGTVRVGFYFVNVQTVQLDDASFRAGQMSVPALEYSGSFDINGKPVTFAAAAPTTGTWPVGARVFNSTPALGQPKGWICTVAGAPGTWVSEGNL